MKKKRIIILAHIIAIIIVEAAILGLSWLISTQIFSQPGSPIQPLAGFFWIAIAFHVGSVLRRIKEFKKVPPGVEKDW